MEKQKRKNELFNIIKSADGVDGIEIYGYLPLTEYLYDTLSRRDKELLTAFAERIKAHYPHTASIQSTIDKELSAAITGV